MRFNAFVNGNTAIVLFAHGARDPQWAVPLRRIQRIVAERSPGTPVELAFLELMQPSLGEAIRDLAARGVERVTLVPLFIAQGGHLKQDLPRLLERACADSPGVSVRVAPALGEVDTLLAGIADWIVAEHTAGVASGAGFANPVA